MRIAIASGKGGTGKTTVAANLARVAAARGLSAAYVDCDVEAPNGHLFLKPDMAKRQPTNRMVPEVDPERCTSCGRCGQICQYSAIVPVGKKVLVFPELCHSCGGCIMVCRDGALSEGSRELGTLERGSSGALQFLHGVMTVGEASSPPLIRAVKNAAPKDGLVIYDAPPGTACAAVEAIRDADYVVLVTEPTPFGLNDLKLAVRLVRELELPCGVVINRSGMHDQETLAFCQTADIPVLATIADDRTVAEAYSRGELACDTIPAYRQTFEQLLDLLLHIESGSPTKTVCS